MKDVRIKRKADITSDHHLMLTGIKLKLKKQWITGKTALQRSNTVLFRDHKKRGEYKIALSNLFQALQDLLKEEETTMKTNPKRE